MTSSPSSRRRLRALIPVLAAVALVVPVVALAAPDRTYTLSATTVEAAWDGPSANGSYHPVADFDVQACSKDAATYCDQTLIRIDSDVPVKIDATIGDFSNPLADFDLWVHKSDASGKAGTEVDIGEDTGAPSGFEESGTASNVEPGYYLVTVSYFQTFGGASYHGTFKVTGATGGGGTATPSASPGASVTPDPSATPTASPTASPTPSPSATPGALPLRATRVIGSAKKAKKKKSLKFRVTAGADITNLLVSVVKGAKKVMATARIASLPKGTKKIKLKVSKKIKKGSYTLRSQGDVNGTTLRAAQKVRLKK